MLFRTDIKSYPHKIDPNYLKYNILEAAELYIIYARLSATDIILNNFLIDSYKISLKQACLAIIRNARVELEPSKGYALIYFNSDEIEKLARFITYGSGPIIGSQILKQALN